MKNEMEIPKSIDISMWPRFPIILSVKCQNDIGVTQVIDIKCDFLNAQRFSEHSASGFIHLTDLINKFLEEDYPDFHISGSIDWKKPGYRSNKYSADGPADIFAPNIAYKL